MNAVQLCVLGPIILALSYGLTHLLWTGVGGNWPRRKRRLFQRMNKTDQREIATQTPIAAFTRARIGRARHFAAVPRESCHGIGSHLNN